MSRISVARLAMGQASLVPMMLCAFIDGFNGTVGLSLSQVFLESISEDGQLLTDRTIEATVRFSGASSRPAAVHLSRHLGVISSVVTPLRS